ncbi:MAG: hypothetical protein OXE42_05135 [Gammaproteobacteria bacterium]|nr:hypothetical protein [Gammaproteobacteria bacterium]
MGSCFRRNDARISQSASLAADYLGMEEKLEPTKPVGDNAHEREHLLLNV